MKTRKKSFWQRWYRYFYLRLLRRRSTPRQIGRGLAVGIFSGMFPLFGLQTLIALGLATLVNGDKIVAALGTWVTNPFTDLPVFWFNFQVGTWLFRRLGTTFHQPRSWQELWDMGLEFLLVWLTGCFVVGTIAALLGYAIGLILARKIIEAQKSA